MLHPQQHQHQHQLFNQQQQFFQYQHRVQLEQQLAELYAQFYSGFATWAGQRLLLDPLAGAALATSGIGPVVCLNAALADFLHAHQLAGQSARLHASLVLRCLDQAALGLSPVVRQVLHSLSRSVSRHLNAGRMFKQLRACLLRQMSPQLRRRHQQNSQQQQQLHRPQQQPRQQYHHQQQQLPQPQRTAASAVAAATYEDFQQQQQHAAAAAAAVAAAASSAAAIGVSHQSHHHQHLLGSGAYASGSLLYQQQQQHPHHYASPLFYPYALGSPAEGYYCCPPAAYPGLLLHFLALLDGSHSAAAAAASAASASQQQQPQAHHQNHQQHHQQQHMQQHIFQHLELQQQQQQQPSNLDSLLHLAAQVGGCRPRGAAKEELDSLPAYRYQPGRRHSESRQASCVVCLAEFEPRQQLRGLACGHEFHVRCVDRWLRHNRSCPICRADAVNGRPQANQADC